MLVLKYKAVHLEDYIQNAEVIESLRNELQVPSKCSVPNFLLYGESGSGKTTICNLLLQQLEPPAEAKRILQSNIIKKEYIKDLYRYSTPYSVFIIDNVQHYANVAEKQQLYNLIHLNSIHHFATIVIITNQPQQKFIQEKLAKKCKSYYFQLPPRHYITAYIQQICAKEQITLSAPLQTIIEEHRGNIDSILSYISLIQSQEAPMAQKYSSFTSLSTIDILSNLLTQPHNYHNTCKLIKYATFVLPMFMYSNFYKGRALTTEQYIQVIEDMKKGDIIECAVFHAQKWYLNDTHIFYSIIRPSNYLQTTPHASSKPFKLIQYFNKKPPSIGSKLEIFQFKVIQRYAREKQYDKLKQYIACSSPPIDLDALLRKFGQIKLISMKMRKHIIASNLQQQ